MSNLSNFKITFDPSNDYRRCVAVIHFFTVVVLLQCSLPFFITLLSVGLLILLAIKWIANGIPLRRYRQLIWHSGHWLLYENNEKKRIYDRIAIESDFGLFLTLKLETNQEKMRLLLFKDQLSNAQYRSLKQMANKKSLSS